MTKHFVSEKDPTLVTGASEYRITFTSILTPEHPKFSEMQEHFKQEHWRPEGYGLAFMESPEHSRLYLGSIEQIKQFKAKPSPLDLRQGVLYEFWPDGGDWDEYIPDSTWNPDGLGILGTFDHPHGNEVVVYEFHGSWRADQEKRRLVTYHCTHCHKDTFREIAHVQVNTGPRSRRWVARKARRHVLDAERHGVDTRNSGCRKMNPGVTRVVAQVASQMRGHLVPEVSHESRCFTTGPCSTIRHLRARS